MAPDRVPSRFAVDPRKATTSQGVAYTHAWDLLSAEERAAGEPEEGFYLLDIDPHPDRPGPEIVFTQDAKLFLTHCALRHTLQGIPTPRKIPYTVIERLEALTTTQCRKHPVSRSIGKLLFPRALILPTDNAILASASRAAWFDGEFDPELRQWSAEFESELRDRMTLGHGVFDETYVYCARPRDLSPQPPILLPGPFSHPVVMDINAKFPGDELVFGSSVAFQAQVMYVPRVPDLPAGYPHSLYPAQCWRAPESLDIADIAAIHERAAELSGLIARYRYPSPFDPFPAAVRFALARLAGLEGDRAELLERLAQYTEVQSRILDRFHPDHATIEQLGEMMRPHHELEMMGQTYFYMPPQGGARDKNVPPTKAPSFVAHFPQQLCSTSTNFGIVQPTKDEYAAAIWLWEEVQPGTTTVTSESYIANRLMRFHPSDAAAPPNIPLKPHRLMQALVGSTIGERFLNDVDALKSAMRQGSSESLSWVPLDDYRASTDAEERTRWSAYWLIGKTPRGPVFQASVFLPFRRMMTLTVYSDDPAFPSLVQRLNGDDTYGER